eukprot:jgi/Galph1/609/GphlegSOOS_G5339.1
MMEREDVDTNQTAPSVVDTSQIEVPNERILRIIHWTDVHFHVMKLPNLLPTLKQAMGLVHLYVRGRKSEFNPMELIPVFIEQIEKLQPDLLIFSGDLTALALPAEFETALSVLSPLLKKYPNIMIAGNHDRYTKGNECVMEQYFGEYMRGGTNWKDSHWERQDGQETWPHVFDTGTGLKIITLDQARPSKWSFGENSKDQLQRLEELLQRYEPENCIVVGHYPVLDIDGTVFESFGRSLKDVRELYEVLRRQPPLAYLCGHDHEHYMQSMAVAGRFVRFLCCGNTSYVGERERKKAGFFELQISVSNEDEHPRIVSVKRHEWNEYKHQFELLDGPPILFRPTGLKNWIVAQNG